MIGLPSLLISYAGQAAEPLLSQLSSHCSDCHNSETADGEFDLGVLRSDDQTDESRARLLNGIRQRVADGEMPPEDAEPLESANRRAILASLTSELDLLATKLLDDPGHVAMARLTPYEYRNVIRDLSDGIVTDAGRLLPNEGGAGEGFSNVGAAQVMTLAQYEKYMNAAKHALRHLRVYPTSVAGHSEPTLARMQQGAQPPAVDLDWTSFPRPSVDSASTARQEVVDEIIGWYIGQQQKWGEEHRNNLEQTLGFVHAAYLEAAWNYRHRKKAEDKLDAFAFVKSVAGLNESGRPSKQSAFERPPADSESADRTVRLAPAALKKWWNILNSDDSQSPHAAWAGEWRKLAMESDLTQAEVRRRCAAIVAGSTVEIETEDYAPPYEISFHEAKEEVLEAAEQEGRWPFRIEIGDARELFLVVTDAGDGRNGEYAVWRRGRFIYRDGTSKPWQDAVTILGANSGREYPFGYDGEKSKVFGKDAIGAKPPGALKFAVPKDAIVFEVDLTLDENRTRLASIQALVLKQKPKSQSYIRGRFVFGGKKRPVTAQAKLKKEHERALRKRNVSEANKTKIGLNAERNIFAQWNRTPIESIGGPWPDHEMEKLERQFPYHYTVPEVLQNASPDDLAQLRRLENRLAALIDGRSEEELHATAEAVIVCFARMAWRREITAKELEVLMTLYQDGRTQKLAFDSAVKSPLTMVLASPHFIYKRYSATRSADTRSAHEDSQTAPLSSHALATRLAFFLWGSIPDDELLSLAGRDELREPDFLRAQARRMLKDSRARSLAVDFAGQLWGFTGFERFDNPDADRFPVFTPSLRKAMQEEVETFLADVFQNDRPLTNVLDADYSFVNGELARHYELSGASFQPMESRSSPAGSLRRVSLPPERGGLATMGLFLTKTSLPLRTSPVQRGVWVMESLLGRHLPNPPAGVPSLSDDDTDAEGLNVREQLERHRAQESCARCHDRIDPLGISLENFDAVGGWRKEERDGTALVTTASTHDGAKLIGSPGLKSYLSDHKAEFIDHFNRKLLGYALGRAVHIGDRTLLTRMKRRLESDAYRFSVLIEEIVSSPQFRQKRVERE